MRDIYYFNKTAIGYSHIKNNKKCQDFSASYSDNDRIIITACDGHGGNIYVRSDIGAHFASEAIIDEFKGIELSDIRKLNNPNYLENIKLGILCRWNKMVDEHLALHRFTKSEIESLTECERLKLFNNKIKAYGTTLIGAMKLGKKLIVVHLGDGESLLLKKGEIIPVFPLSEDDPVGNVTYSMCEDTAYYHINIKVLDFYEYEGILLCTDGVVNPYQSYVNFNESFVNPLIDKIKSGNLKPIESFITDLGSKYGVGDDVSLSFITCFRSKLKPAYMEYYDKIYNK